jgi:hypothetical protein
LVKFNKTRPGFSSSNGLGLFYQTPGFQTPYIRKDLANLLLADRIPANLGG